VARVGHRTLIALATLALAAPAAGAGASAQASVAKASCANGKMATIAGKRTCLAPHRSCSHKYERQYKKQGYSCVKDKQGRYRLVGLRQSFGF
jgi:hypothetical protein